MRKFYHWLWKEWLCGIPPVMIFYRTCPIHHVKLTKFWQAGSPFSGPEIWKTCHICHDMPEELAVGKNYAK